MLEIILHETVIEDKGEWVDNQGSVVHGFEHGCVPVYSGRVRDRPPLEFERPPPLNMIIDGKYNKGQDLAEGKSDEKDGEEDKDSHLTFDSIFNFFLIVLALDM